MKKLLFLICLLSCEAHAEQMLPTTTDYYDDLTPDFEVKCDCGDGRILEPVEASCDKACKKSNVLDDVMGWLD